jgi:hypothetical protein
MPHIHDKLHLGRRKRIIFRELQLGGENAAFKGCAFRALDQGFPEEHVVFVDGAGGDAFGGVGREGLVFFEEALGGGVGHSVCGGVVGWGRAWCVGSRVVRVVGLTRLLGDTWVAFECAGDWNGETVKEHLV